jgi:phage tail sheath protein FI
LLVPPGGFVAGIYARTDVQRGVWKAPANEVVRGAIDLEFQIQDSDQDSLTYRSVNAIRQFSGRGILLWGARTLAGESDWNYVNVRRLFSFIEQSIADGTRWVVFEPNDEPMWVQFRESIIHFLTQCWTDGALKGTKPEQAFFVKCDRTTMTQEDIDNGRVICVIGIAPLKPAEFVIFRIGQWVGGTEIIE